MGILEELWYAKVKTVAFNNRMKDFELNVRKQKIISFNVNVQLTHINCYVAQPIHATSYPVDYEHL